MNKKFSTLVASLLLAGALVMPMGAYAAVTVTGLGVTDIQMITAQYDNITNGSYYLLSDKQGGGVVTVLTLNGGTLAFKKITEVVPGDMVTIEKTTGDKFYLKVGNQYLAVTEGSTPTVSLADQTGAREFEFIANTNGGKNTIGFVESTNSYYIKADGAAFSQVTTTEIGNAGNGGMEFALVTPNPAADVALPAAGYSVPETLADANVWRYLLTEASKGLKITTSETAISNDLSEASKVMISEVSTGKYNLSIDGKPVQMDGTTMKLSTSGTATTFSFVNMKEADPDNVDNVYLSYTSGEKQYVITFDGTSTWGASVYDATLQAPVANAVALKVVEIAVPADVTLADGYDVVTTPAAGTYNFAVGNGQFVQADFSGAETSATPAAMTLEAATGGFIIKDAEGKTLYVDGASVSFSEASRTVLKFVPEGNNYYLATVDNKYIQADYNAATVETVDGDRPVNPLAIKLCNVAATPAPTPDVDGLAVEQVATNNITAALGKYNYVTYGKLFLYGEGKATDAKGTATMWKVSKVSEGVYSIVDANGNKLAFDKDGAYKKDGEYNTFRYVNGKLSFSTNDKDYYVWAESGAWKATEEAPAYPVVFYVSTLSAFDAANGVKFLNGQLGNSFEVVFKEKNDNGKLVTMTVQDNPFTKGEITAAVGPEAIDNNSHENDPADLSEMMFLKVAGSYPLTKDQLVGLTNAQVRQKQLEAFRASTFISVSATRYSAKITDETTNNFFEYTTVKGSALISKWGSVVDANAIGVNYNEEDYKEGHKLYGVNTPVANASFEVSNYANDSYGDPVYLSNAEVFAPKDGVKNPTLENYESVGSLKVAVKTYLKKNYVGAYDDEAYGMVYFGTTNQVKQKDIVGIVNIISRNYKTYGKVYANDDNNRIDKLDANRVVLHNPEGQFYATATSDNLFTFTNRESGRKAFADVILKKVPGKDNVYAVGNSLTAVEDTVLIAEATVGNMFDGYANYDKDSQLENKAYNILVKSGVTGVDEVYLAENHKVNHTIGASADAEDAVNWRLVKFTAAGDAEKLHNDSIITINEDAISYLSDGEYKTKNDTIVKFVYAMYNEANGEYLNYDRTTNGKAFYCDPEMLAGKASADQIRDNASKFILKEKNDGTYNLVWVDGDGRFDHDPEDGEKYGEFRMSDTKAYIGVNDAKLNLESSIYKISDNDLFIIQEVDAPKYRSVAAFDTIRIYKNDNEKIALYERGKFLGMQHIADVPEMAAAMFVDTAYVSNTNKPQYLLVVEPELIWHDANCNIPGHPAVDPTAVDTVKGRFLVNMVDSLNAWGDLHNNPYEWETYPKLAFKNGYHAANKLVIETAKPSAADVIDLSKNVDKIGTFAFRYVDRSQGSFVIETGTKDSKGNAGTGYIKWLNGTPVVVPQIALAEVFNLNDGEVGNPTDNDAISAATFSVATTDGAVVVKGAEGKNVTITNVLGQVIASATIASSEATINVPAGIVVVAVEGEAAVKAIVK
ncbi:DUF6383 domain-containing protein [Parabacteroides sp.]